MFLGGAGKFPFQENTSVELLLPEGTRGSLCPADEPGGAQHWGGHNVVVLEMFHRSHLHAPLYSSRRPTMSTEGKLGK